MHLTIKAILARFNQDAQKAADYCLENSQQPQA